MPSPALSTIPESVNHADTLIAAFDQCLVSGFSRLGKEHVATLESIDRVFTGTPLEGPVGAAVASVVRGQVSEDHLIALCSARESLFGARYDALATVALDALGESVARPSFVQGQGDERTESLPSEAVTYMASARQWLLEVALAGLGQLEAATIMPFGATLEAMQATPSLFGLAALLTGFFDELMDNLPTSTMGAVPSRRWSDLYSQALLGAWRPRPVHTGETVSGTLRLLGADLRHHDHLVSVAAYGLLQRPDQPLRLVRTTVSTWKVDAVVGTESLLALADAPGGEQLLTAMSEDKALVIDDALLWPSGDLALTGTIALGQEFDPMAAAVDALAPGAKLTIPDQPPLGRHTAHLAIPVSLSEAGFSEHEEWGLRVDVAGSQVPIAWQRSSRLARFDAASLKKCSQVFGLLRYDAGGFEFQPLAARDGDTRLGVAAHMAKALELKKKGHGSTLSTLEERASKLLRAK